MVVAASLCLLGIKWLPALGLGAIASFGAAAYLIFSKAGREQRERGGKLLGKLEDNQAQLAKGARLIMAKYQSRKRQFNASVADLKKAYEIYQSEEDQLQDVLAIQRTAQLNRYLAGQLLQDNVARIPGLTFSILSVLESYGVESAWDVDDVKLMGVPMLSPELTLELLSWRETVVNSFRFKPEHGVSIEDAKLASEAALRRFKIAQARKVLMGGTQLDALAEVGKAEVKRDLKRFNDVAEKGRQIANQLREFQSGRRFLERELNRHPAVTAVVAVGIPLVGYILRIIFG
jgi:DNA-binding helix-hairpin-helix protein with protein kinase domain